MKDVDKLLEECKKNSAKDKVTMLIIDAQRKVGDMSNKHAFNQIEYMFRNKPDWLGAEGREVDARWNSICKLYDDWEKGIIKEDFVKSEVDRITHVKKHYF